MRATTRPELLSLAFHTSPNDPSPNLFSSSNREMDLFPIHGTFALATDIALTEAADSAGEAAFITTSLVVLLNSKIILLGIYSIARI